MDEKFNRISWEIECKKIWLKQPKAASALDFPYFQHASKLVTHDINPLESDDSSGFLLLFCTFQML